jgi:hypothetical protein
MTYMKDPIIEGHLKDFKEHFAVNSKSNENLFEHFANFCVVSRICSDHFEFYDVSTGGGNDTALDGIAIIVNDHLVTSKEAVDFLIKHLNRLDVRFIFIQSKYQKKFDQNGISKTMLGVYDFFEKNPNLQANDNIEHLREIYSYIYSKTIEMEKSPTCEINYVTLGEWNGDKNLEGTIKSFKKRLEGTNLFSKIYFTPIDGKHLKRIYKELRKRIAREVEFSRNTVLPEIPGVSQAYIGIMKGEEYLKLICDEDEILQRNLFYDNVRDFQGYNTVNTEINKSIEDHMSTMRFSLLNNGITIVAKSVNRVGDKFKIQDYQIVNGCQTSHILYYNRNKLGDSLYLPIKLIATDDTELANEITKGTNRQTEVKPEAFQALKSFQKDLEEFYSSMRKKTSIPLYYERRSKQYDSESVKKNEIVTIPLQVNCFISMFLQEPHSTHRYYGELLKTYGNKIFGGSHKLMPYYVSGLTLYLVDRYFFETVKESRMKAFRYHFLPMLYKSLFGEIKPKVRKKEEEKRCSDLLKILTDRNLSYRLFDEFYKTIESTARSFVSDYNQLKRIKIFTTTLLSETKKQL